MIIRLALLLAAAPAFAEPTVTPELHEQYSGVGAPLKLKDINGRPVAADGAQARLKDINGRPLPTDAPQARLKALPTTASGRILLIRGLQTTVTTNKGDVFLEVSPDIDEPLRALHERRAAAMKLDGEAFMKQDAEHVAQPPTADGETASLLLAAHRNGHFSGGIVTTGSQYQPWQVWAYSLKNDKGDTQRVVVTPGRWNGESAICARYYAADNKETDRLVFLAMDTKRESADKGFRSSCD